MLMIVKMVCYHIAESKGVRGGGAMMGRRGGEGKEEEGEEGGGVERGRRRQGEHVNTIPKKVSLSISSMDLKPV